MAYPMYQKQDRTQPTAADDVKIPETNLSSEEIEDILTTAKVQMLIKAPFFGQLACRMRFIDATEWCPTAATDGRNFYYNRHFTAALHERDPQQVIFLVGHEVLHCVHDHMNRRGDRIPELFNIANDYCVNGDLVDARVGTMIDLVKICYDRKYRGMFSEEIYDELYEEADSEGRIKHVPMDMHLDPDSAGEPGEGDDAPGEGNNDGTQGPIRYSQAEREMIASEVRDSVESAARSSDAGNLPAGVRRIVDSLLNPQLDWRELLAMHIQSVLKNDYTFQRISRKSQESGIFLPGMDNDQTIDIAIGIDMSGSISNEQVLDFLSEVKGIMDQYSDFKIHLFCFDTQVYNYQVFTENNMDEFLDYEPAGGGGTDFMVCYDFMKDQGIQPQRFVMFTDMYPCGSWGDPDYTETLFVAHSKSLGGDYPTAPFGITVPYTREE